MLELQDIEKTYGPARVLDRVDLVARPGQIHAVLGENGAGKSTLVKIAAGLVRPDGGRVIVGGEPLRSSTPRAAREAGVAIATQELTCVPGRTVLENVFLGHPVATVGSLRRSSATRRFAEVCEESGFSLPSDALVSDLSIADQQILEVLRCLIRRPKVLILDEPTSSLDEERAERLRALLRRLSDTGATVLFISHFLNEVLEAADWVTVLRDGKLVSSGPTAAETESSLITKMVGRSLSILYSDKRRPVADAETVLEADDVWWGSAVRGVSLEVRRGEIVGLAGLVGAGRTEFARCVAGAAKPDRGTVRIAGGPPTRPRHPRQGISAGLVMVPEDRKGQGLVLGRTVAENLALPRPETANRIGFALPRRLERAAREWIRRADIRPPSPDALVGELSGGNQQKVLLSKWLACEPQVLIADEPTRGVDVGAKVAIHTMITEAAASGIGVLLISSELEELLGLAHRILVFRKGMVVDEVEGAPTERERIMTAAFGAAEVRGDE
ncbi:MAG TPA: sugar ABC transporter ATP-binding protein [Solirubrobacteraceae bacterium]|nr:sugar ABC transporter ATP-binding protein [Solirubrobacteraceae bacterium]